MLRIFECSGCGYQFRVDIPSAVHRCMMCERPLVADGFSFNGLDPYSQMKYHWIKNPQYHADNIKHRAKDSHNVPDILEIN